MGRPEPLKMHRLPCIFHEFFGGVGNMGSPESLEMQRFPLFFHNFFGGMGSVGSPKSLNMIDSYAFLMISSMEWEAWEAQNH